MGPKPPRWVLNAIAVFLLGTLFVGFPIFWTVFEDDVLAKTLVVIFLGLPYVALGFYYAHWSDPY